MFLLTPHRLANRDLSYSERRTNQSNHAPINDSCRLVKHVFSEGYSRMLRTLLFISSRFVHSLSLEVSQFPQNVFASVNFLFDLFMLDS